MSGWSKTKAKPEVNPTPATNKKVTYMVAFFVCWSNDENLLVQSEVSLVVADERSKVVRSEHRSYAPTFTQKGFNLTDTQLH